MLGMSTQKSPCCKASIYWEVAGGGIRLYREVDGKKIYPGRCSACKQSLEICEVPPPAKKAAAADPGWTLTLLGLQREDTEVLKSGLRRLISDSRYKSGERAAILLDKIIAAENA